MSSLTYKLQKLAARRLAGKKPMVLVGDLRYEFSGVMFGGVSPLGVECKTAAAWRKLGANL